MPTRNWIDCATCGKHALVRVGAAFCSPECQKRNKLSPTPNRKPGRPKGKKTTEAEKRREAIGKVRL